MPSGKHISWETYDDYIITHLPTMTIEQFTKTYTPHISTKAVGARARKLNVKPAVYKLTLEHKNKISNAISKETPELILKISKLRDSLSLRLLAKECGIGIPTLSRLNRKYNIGLSEKGLKRARESSRNANIGKIPWNKGKQLPDEMKINMAIGRQRMSGRLSSLQSAFYKILDDNDINYHREESDLCRFGHWTFDCRITHGNHDFLVEVQGDYIHSQVKNISKDRAKSTYMERYFSQIPIKYIYEHEFGAVNRVKQVVRKWLDLDNVQQIEFEFSNVSIRLIEEDEASRFLSSFHYLGRLSGRIRLGAFINDKLVAVSIWSAPTRIETARRLNVMPQQCLELRRFVIHDAYHKYNFGSWLLSRMEKQLPKTINILVSFADPGVGHDGALYKAANWTSDGMSESSYFYIDNDGYVLLKKTLFNLANKMHMREADFAYTYNYKKVPSPPKFRYIKRR